MSASRVQISLPKSLVTKGSVHGLRLAGKLATPADVKSALEAVRRGEHVALEIEATTFIQRDTPNRNFTRFSPKILGDLAASFADAPFQADHSEKVRDRGGTVRSSRLEEEDGAACFRMSIEVTKQWAVEGVLDGTIDRFSIAWNPTGDVICSICREALANYKGWTYQRCDHMPGEAYEERDAEGTVLGMKVCELIYTAAEGTEVSAVSIPAVVGTEIESIRAAFAAARQGPNRESDMSNYATIISILGLAADSTPSNTEGVVKMLKAERDSLKAERDRLDTMLGAERETGKKLAAELSEAREQLGASERKEREGKIDALVTRALSEGRIQPAHDEDGKSVPSKGEIAVRKLAAASLADAEEWVNELPRVTPVGTERQSAGKDPAPKGKKGRLGLSELELKAAKSAGVTPEDFAKTKAKMAGEEIADDKDEE